MKEEKLRNYSAKNNFKRQFFYQKKNSFLIVF